MTRRRLLAAILCCICVSAAIVHFGCSQERKPAQPSWGTGSAATDPFDTKIHDLGPIVQRERERTVFPELSSKVKDIDGDGDLNRPAEPGAVPNAAISLNATPSTQSQTRTSETRRLDSTLPGNLGGARASRGKSIGGAGPRERVDEVVVIERNRDALAGEMGAGALLATIPGETKQVTIPLKHTDVHASVTGYISTVDVKQQYQNPYSSKIEAVYVFPLPSDAAVTDFVMTIGDRHIRGIIREKEEAQRIYNEARSQGYVASLMTQERPNIFTQRVANIEPGKAIDVDIKYFNALTYSDGWYEFVFPMVVGPRFNPPNSTDGIGSKPRGAAPGSTGQPTEIAYLKPNERSGHDIALTLDIDAGVNIEQLDSRNHQIETKNLSPSRAQITLKDSDRIPNKDFVLRYKVAGDRMKSAMLVQRDPKNPDGAGYFTLMLFPPDSMKDLPRKPLEMVFTLDVSGSMDGRPLDQAKAAVKWALVHMNSRDSFQIVAFDNNASQMSGAPLSATDDNIYRGLVYLKQMHGGGGTMMLEGMRNSLNFPHDPQRSRYVAFLTDGFIGNEAEILGAMRTWLGDSRVFSFGVGQSTNRYLLDSMAKLGNGVSTYLGLNDDASLTMSAYFERISHPALTDVRLDFGSEARVTDVYPSKLPDLIVGRPVIVTGRFTGGMPPTVKLAGNIGGETRTWDIRASEDSSSTEHAGIASVWARHKIADLCDRATYDRDVAQTLPKHVCQVSLEYGLMSQFTSFVAVDSSQRTAGSSGTTVNVPVPVPEGVKYETAVGER